MKRLLENWRKLLEGDVIPFPGNEYERLRRQTGIRLPLKPGGPAYKGREETEEEYEGGGPMEAEVPRNAMIANEIDSTIQSHMTKKYGSPEDWTLDQLNAIDQISDLLDVIFPSGE